MVKVILSPGCTNAGGADSGRRVIVEFAVWSTAVIKSYTVSTVKQMCRSTIWMNHCLNRHYLLPQDPPI